MILRGKARKIYRKVRDKFSIPNPDAILLFGLNESGTSATINLIARRADISFFDDLSYKLGDWDDVLEKKIEFNKYLSKHGYAFSKDLIRFPMNRRALGYIASFFSMDRYIITIRNPVENIKSILSRLKLPGNIDSLDIENLKFHPDWLNMLNRKEHYIDSLLDCWLEAYSLDELVNNANAVIFKYEDFKRNKIEYVTQKVNELGLIPRESIEDLVNVQYQPKGTQSTNMVFFGRKNLEKIINQTQSLANDFGYDLNEFLKNE